jgi:FkbM family methyltransferase
MFLLKFLQPTLFVNLIKMLLSCDNKIGIINVGLFNKAQVISFNIKDKNYKLFLRTKGDIAIVFEMFFLGVYPFEMFKEGIDNALDLGAHIGIPAIILAKTINVQKIYSLEPVKENYEVLVKNIELNGLKDKVIPIFAGIGAKDETLEINKSNSTNSHSIVMEEGTSVKEKIEVITIDSLVKKYDINKFDLIKMDIEGYEYSVFKTLIGFIGSSKYFTMERHDIEGHDFETEINQSVIEMGFELKSIINPGPVYTYLKK